MQLKFSDLFVFLNNYIINLFNQWLINSDDSDFCRNIYILYFISWKYNCNRNLI